MQIYVGNVSKHISDAQFRELVSPFGEVESITIPRDAKGRGQGYGLVEYADSDQAGRAITSLHGKDIDGQLLNASAMTAPEHVY